MSEKFVLSFTDYIPEVKKNLYWEVIVKDDEVCVVQRGGPLEPTVLTVKLFRGNESEDTCLEVDDWWGWGAG